MRENRRRRLNRHTAEQLLRGAPSGPAGLPADRDALATLLAVAAAPAHGRELASEEEAVAAFRATLLGPAPHTRRPSMSATKLLVAKAVIAVVGVSGGGVALAAATGHLPSSLTGRPAAAASASSGGSAASQSAAGGKPASHPTASPSPSLRGLCQAYTAHAGSSPGRELSNPAFTALLTAAGGKAQVAAFCANLLATHPGGKPSSRPHGKPSSLPSAANTTHPTGKPTTVPSDHPTGAPTSHP